jgi:hypothetical protein
VIKDRTTRRRPRMRVYVREHDTNAHSIGGRVPVLECCNALSASGNAYRIGAWSCVFLVQPAFSNAREAQQAHSVCTIGGRVHTHALGCALSLACEGHA